MGLEQTLSSVPIDEHLEGITTTPAMRFLREEKRGKTILQFFFPHAQETIFLEYTLAGEAAAILYTHKDGTRRYTRSISTYVHAQLQYVEMPDDEKAILMSLR